MAELRKADPSLSQKDAMREASKRWKARKEGAAMAETKVTGVPRRAKLEIPLVVDTRPDEAAGWDVVEGLLDGLMARANTDDRASLIARAGQAFQVRQAAERQDYRLQLAQLREERDDWKDRHDAVRAELDARRAAGWPWFPRLLGA